MCECVCNSSGCLGHWAAGTSASTDDGLQGRVEQVRKRLNEITPEEGAFCLTCEAVVCKFTSSWSQLAIMHLARRNRCSATAVFHVQVGVRWRLRVDRGGLRRSSPAGRKRNVWRHLNVFCFSCGDDLMTLAYFKTRLLSMRHH